MDGDVNCFQVQDTQYYERGIQRYIKNLPQMSLSFISSVQLNSECVSRILNSVLQFFVNVRHKLTRN